MPLTCLSNFFLSHTKFNHISDEIISSTFLVRKEPACDSVDQCFLPLSFFSGFIITKSLVSIVDFKIFKIYLKKTSKIFSKEKKILNILHISMKLIRVYVICIDMYVSRFSIFRVTLVTDLMYDCVVLILQQVKNQQKKRHQVL